MKNLILYIVKNLVKSPEDVFVESQENGNFTTFIVKVKEEDKGLLIGANGKTISIIKDIVRAKDLSQKIEIKVVANG
ncbi:MAG: KH domain-containing protein [Clostridia bacterium]|nr:KH domain-containing protein [Clostridia bacterium]MBR5226887.1 KH domain-containing protein [Clostridia bacterium]